MGLMPIGELGLSLTGEPMRIPDIIGCMGWVAAFLAAIVVIPVAGLFIGLLTPLPFIYYLLGIPLRYAAQFTAAVIGAVLLLALVLGLEKLGLFCLEFGVLGLWLAQAFQRRLTIGKTIVSGTAVLIGVGLAVLTITAIGHNTSPVEMIKNYIEANLNISVETYRFMGLPPDRAVEMKTYAEFIRKVLLRIYPSLMVVGSAFVVWLNVILSIKFFASKGIGASDRAQLAMWKAPEHLVWSVIISGFSLFLPIEGIRFVALNLLIVLMTIYLFQGMAIVSYFVNRFRVPSWIRLALYFFIAVQQFFLVLLALAGLFDQWVNFRRAGINKS